MLRAAGRANESTRGVLLDALVALEKNEPMGFDYRDVSLPVHVFHGKADRMVRACSRLTVHGGSMVMTMSSHY